MDGLLESGSWPYAILGESRDPNDVPHPSLHGPRLSPRFTMAAIGDSCHKDPPHLWGGGSPQG